MKKLITKISKNFFFEEFSCPCCGLNNISDELVQALQELRDKLLLPIKVNSGTRCQDRNAAIGGVPKSLHLVGRAADIFVIGMNPDQIVKSALEIDAFRNSGIGLYKSYVHLDVGRKKPARWGDLPKLKTIERKK